jgi:hypothetical protein
VYAQGLRSGHTKSCGCYDLQLKRERRGIKHPNFNQDLTDEERMKDRSHVLVDLWSKAVLIKDGYTCRKCGKTGGRLEAHHLDGWHWCKDKRFDLLNGGCLCVSCHKSFHRTFGIKHNTRDQFLDFTGENIKYVSQPSAGVAANS